jgi:hypothetical protein
VDEPGTFVTLEGGTFLCNDFGGIGTYPPDSNNQKWNGDNLSYEYRDWRLCGDEDVPGRTVYVDIICGGEGKLNGSGSIQCEPEGLCSVGLGWWVCVYVECGDECVGGMPTVFTSRAWVAAMETDEQGRPTVPCNPIETLNTGCSQPFPQMALTYASSSSSS